MAQRAIRLFFHLHRVCCPNCQFLIEYKTLTEILPNAEKSWPQSSKAFLMVNGHRVKGNQVKRVKSLIEFPAPSCSFNSMLTNQLDLYNDSGSSTGCLRGRHISRLMSRCCSRS